MRTSGTNANGMPKDKTTCEMISSRVGSRPTASRINAGTAVTSRRTRSGIRRCSSPSMITAPA